MASLNEVKLMGNLTRDPEVRYLQSGMAVCEIGLAVNKHWTDRQTGQRREEVAFFNVTFFGRSAEVCGEYLHKGNPIFIEAHLKTDSWQDRETGKMRYALKILGDRMQMLGSRNGSSNSNGGGGYSRGGNQGGYEPEPEPDEPGSSEQYFPRGNLLPADDNVPF